MRAGLIITRFTFLRSLAHVYNMEQSIVFRYILCDRELQTARTDENITENTAHLLSEAVQLLCDCDFSGLLRGGDAESMLKASKGSQHVSYVCTWPNYPMATDGLSLLGLHFIITELLMISINYSYYRYPQLHTKMCTRNTGALVQVRGGRTCVIIAPFNFFN